MINDLDMNELTRNSHMSDDREANSFVWTIKDSSVDAIEWYEEIKSNDCPINSKNYTRSKLIVDINGQVALFRDLLIHIGQAKDCPELREKIRKLRRTCVEACKHTGQLILPQLRRYAACPPLFTCSTSNCSSSIAPAHLDTTTKPDGQLRATYPPVEQDSVALFLLNNVKQP
ncbi:hypothetical protein FQA39_LY11215 [Lamprigera yunnana]|nr:hypothetical protein FQA39_LY11215 [Lamprigera yunnana]